MSRRLHAALALGSLLALAPRLDAQESLLPSTAWGTGINLSAWHFGTALPQASGGLADVAQLSVPFRMRSAFGRWTMDLSGAAGYSAVHYSIAATGPSAESDDRLTTLFGLTDLKVRLSGPVIGESVLLTTGVNLPVGKTGLSSDETSVLQVVSAPGLAMPIAALGTGAGFTVGVIKAFQGEDWAVALGGSLEKRSEYSAIALALSTGKAETRITPGTAAHVTLGYDRPLGENRFSAVLVGDIYGKDVVSSAGAATARSASYQLGPQITATTRLDIAASRWRESALTLSVRQRSAFSDSSGAKVSGSAGTYLDASFGGVRGGAEGAGFLFGVDARWHSGLTFTDALVGAAVTAAGVTVGVERAGTSVVTRLFLRGQYGTFDTGTAHATGMGATLGFSLSGRRDAR